SYNFTSLDHDGIFRCADEADAGTDDDILIQNRAVQLRACADGAVVHDDAFLHLCAFIQTDLPEKYGAIGEPVQLAAVGHDAVANLTIFPVGGGNPVSNFCINIPVCAEQAVPRVKINQGQIVAIVLLGAFVEHGHAVK